MAARRIGAGRTAGTRAGVHRIGGPGAGLCRCAGALRRARHGRPGRRRGAGAGLGHLCPQPRGGRAPGGKHMHAAADRTAQRPRPSAATTSCWPSAASAGNSALLRRPAHVADRCAPGRPRHPARAGAAMGAVAADPAARAAGRAAGTGHAGAAGGAARGHATSAAAGGAQGRRRPRRRRHADPALWLGGQPQHPPALSGTGRGVPVRRRWLAGLRRGGCAHRRRTARAAADGHRPADEDAHAPGRAGRGHGPDLPGRAGCRR